jgi:hypothetical protein
MAAVCRRTCGVTVLPASRGASDDVEAELLGEGVVAERGVAVGREQHMIGQAPAFGHPRSEKVDGVRGERGDAPLAALTLAADVGLGADVDVPATQPGSALTREVLFGQPVAASCDPAGWCGCRGRAG